MEELLNRINELYDLKLTFVQKVEKGFLSENYFLLDENTKFFLKKYRFDNADRIKEVHASKKYFSNGGIPVILPIKTTVGETFFSYEGSFYALFPFVEGKHLERGSFSDRAIISMAETLAKIHLLGKVATLNNSEKFKIEDEVKTFKKIENILAEINKKNQTSDFDKLALENINLKKKLLQENTLTMESLGFVCDHLIHGDYSDQNIFFDNNDVVSHVFDFEKTNYSPRVYELFRSMFYGFLGKGNDMSALEDAKKYLDAYSNIYPISKDEIIRGLKLYFIKIIHGFWVENEHYLKGSTRVDHFLTDDLDRIKYFSENLNEIANFLTS